MKLGKVKISRSQLAHFRTKARESKKEILAYLLGDVSSPELSVIHRLCYPKAYNIQTSCRVEVSEEAEAEAKLLAESCNLRIIGTIHSHPDWVPILSPLDYKEHIISGDRISAVVGVNGRKTRVYFWVAESALPLRIEYC